MSSEKTQKNMLYKSLFENAFSVMMILDPDTGEILDVNKAALSFYQYSKTEFLDMNISQINKMSDSQVKNAMNAANLEEKNYFIFDHHLKNGEIRSVEVYSGPIEFKDKKVLCSIIHDISHRQQAEETLRQSDSTIRAMINATTSLVFLFDLEGKIIDMNHQGARLFNKKPNEMVGQKFELFFEENDYARIGSLVAKVVETQKSLSYQRERNNRHFEVSLYPVFNKENNVDRICVFAKDITDLKMTEKVFAAIETAGGICHEMNQPLQVILGNLELLKLNTPDDDPNQTFIDVLLKHTERLGHITKKLTHITRYETKEYIKGTIFDIDKSTQ